MIPIGHISTDRPYVIPIFEHKIQDDISDKHTCILGSSALAYVYMCILSHLENKNALLSLSLSRSLAHCHQYTNTRQEMRWSLLSVILRFLVLAAPATRATRGTCKKKNIRSPTLILVCPLCLFFCFVAVPLCMSRCVSLFCCCVSRICVGGLASAALVV
jgi:hypothetical protein